jgi:gliding motility-associatede transport system auxiliary component
MSERDTSTRRRVTEASTLSAGVILVAVLLVLVNYLGWKYHKRFDWTKTALYTLSEKTENVLAGLDRDIDVVVFMQPGDELYAPVKELLARYDAATPHITVREVDPSRNLAEAQALVEQYEIESVNVILFKSGDDRRLVEASDLAEYDYSGMQFNQPPKMTGFKGEERFTSALLELTETEQQRVLFTSGHGELQLTDFSPSGLSSAKELLERDNFVVEPWESLGATEVPAGTALVVIAGPTGNFLEPELVALAAFLKQGGRLLVMVDPTLSAGGGGLVDTGLGEFLSRYGVDLGDDIVVDPANPLPFFGADTIFVDSYGTHAITRPLAQAKLPTILSLARSVGDTGDADGYDVTKLLMTTADGWGETDLANLGAIKKGDDDVAGPVSLGVAVSAHEAPPEDEAMDGAADEASAPEGAADDEAAKPGERLVVLGDATFATNGQLQNVGNLTLLSDSLNWLAEREALVAIAPKAPESVRLSLSSSQIRRIFWFVVLGLPAIVVGFGIWVQRRRRR